MVHIVSQHTNMVISSLLIMIADTLCNSTSVPHDPYGPQVTPTASCCSSNHSKVHSFCLIHMSGLPILFKIRVRSDVQNNKEHCWNHDTKVSMSIMHTSQLWRYVGVIFRCGGLEGDLSPPSGSRVEPWWGSMGHAPANLELSHF